MEQLRRKMMKMVVMINVVSMLMMRTVRMTRPYVERASLRMSISSRTPSPPPAADVICEQPLTNLTPHYWPPTTALKAHQISYLLDA